MTCSKCGKDMSPDRVEGGWGSPVDRIWKCDDCHMEHHSHDYFGEYDVDLNEEMEVEDLRVEISPW